MHDFWITIRTIHLVAMALFLGGQLFLVIAVVPVERLNPSRERMLQIARRFGWATLGAIGVLLATGSALASHYQQWKNPDLHAKLGLVVLIGVLLVAHMYRPRLRIIDGAIFLSTLAIVWLGVAISH